VLVAVFDYPARGATPAFNLTLKVNFVDGGVDERVGGDGVPLRGERRPPGARRRRGHRLRRPPCPRSGTRTPEGGHPVRRRAASLRRARRLRRPARPLPDFFTSVRGRKPVVEDALYGLRAAAPSLLCNLSYDKGRP